MAATEPVTILKSKAAKMIAQVREKRKPVLITRHGLQARIEILEGVARGEAAIRDGLVLSHERVVKKIKRRLK